MLPQLLAVRSYCLPLPPSAIFPSLSFSSYTIILRKLSASPRAGSQKLRRSYTRRRGGFVDRVQLLVSGGKGGDGCVSFTRGPNQEIVPADGGSGGNGGSVFIESRLECTSLRMSQRQIRAEAGGKGAGSLRRGKAGTDKVLPVPLGTLVRLVGNEEDASSRGLVINDLNTHGHRVEVARGGSGGKGNAHFKSSTMRSPYMAQVGAPGESKLIDLELKTIADVGLVGFPNAGKSTLLRAMSHAKPKVANYPFTTLRPHIGVATCKLNSSEDEGRCTIADIPGLIEGAHENRGLGHEFLRHIERTNMLIYVLDMSEGDTSLGVSHCQSGPVFDLEVLKHELEMYQEGLASRNSVVVANKMDTGVVAIGNLRRLLTSVPKGTQVFPASALEGAGVQECIAYIIKEIRAMR